MKCPNKIKKSISRGFSKKNQEITLERDGIPVES
jgi:hypothetical protein